MTTRQFITKAFNGETRATKNSSVFADNGAIYSYGYHYPLLFKINGHNVRNVTGYSPTTGRHIQWSRDIDAIDVHAGGNFRLRGTDAEILQQLLDGQRYFVQSQISRKHNHLGRGRRTDTQVYRNILDAIERAENELKALEAIVA